MAEEVGYVESPPELGIMVGIGIVATIMLAFLAVLLIVVRR